MHWTLWLFPVEVKIPYFQQNIGEDTADLFLEEREKEIQEAQKEKMKAKASVPGILNPYEWKEEDMKD